MPNLGDLTLNILLNINSADKNAKQFTATLKGVTTQSGELAGSTVKLSDRLQNIGLRFQGIQAVVDVLKNSFGDLIRAYNEQAIATAKLSNGLKNVGEGTAALNRLNEQASALQKVTVYDDAQINNAQAMLTTFMKSSEEIEILTPRLLDLAAAFDQSGEGGKSLQEVAVMLGKVNEETIGALRRVGVAFTKEQEEKLKSLRGTQQAIYLTEILDQNFKGMAVTVGDTTAGKMKIFQNSIGELKEEWGKLLVDILIPILEPLKNFIKLIQDFPPNIKAATLAASALATAFVFLNGSLPSSVKFIGMLLPIVIALPDPLRAVAITVGLVAGAIKLLGGDINTVINLLPKMSSAAASSGSAMARIFNTGGPIVIAIGIAIWWVNELINRISEAEREARKLDNYRRSLAAGTDIPSFNPNSPGIETINKFKALLEKDPEKTISIDGQPQPLKDYVKTLEEAHSKSVQMGKTWNEMTGQTSESMKKPKRSLEEVNTLLESAEKKISQMKPDDPLMRVAVSQRNALLSEREAIEKITNPPSSKTGGPSRSPSPPVQLGMLANLQKELAEIQDRINNQSEGESIIEGLFGTKEEIENKIELINAINTGFKDYIKIKSGIAEVTSEGKISFTGRIPDDPELALRTKEERARNEEERKRNSLETSQNYQQGFENSLGLAIQINSVLGLGADSFVSKFIGGIQEGVSIVSSILNIVALFSKAGATGGFSLFSLLGFAGGGTVPGSGSGDTVPAMLTPGEFVINKQRASMLGSGFLNWLNGGGAVTNRITPAITGVREVPYFVSLKAKGGDLVAVVTKAEKTINRRQI